MHHSNSVYQNLPRATSVFGSWPPASENPLFYISIYAAIGLASALSSVLSVTAQYTGALRASRILFKYVLALFTRKTLPTYFFSFSSRQLLVTVVRATFRFHDTTPQGALAQFSLIILSIWSRRSYAEPLWKGRRDDRFFFSWFTPGCQFLARGFLCRYHHRRVGFFPNEYHRFG